ncbi:MAG: hypothetical protein Kow0013_26450 [Pararhodobacter sp.]
MADFLSVLVPEVLGPSVTLALLGSSFVASFITITFGIGGGALLLAIMASLMPPAALIPVHGIVQLGSNTGRAALLARHVHRPVLLWFGLGAVIGTAIGGMITVNIPPALVQAGVGVFIIWTVLAKPPQWMRKWPALTGALTSILTMLFGATGPFVAAFTRTLTLGRMGYGATHAALMVLQHALKIVAFGFLGFAFGPWIGFCAAMIAAGFAGTWIGRQVLHKLSDLHFDFFLKALLVVISLRLIWTGLSAL